MLKNRLQRFLEKHLIDNFLKNTFRESILVKNTSDRNFTKQTLNTITYDIKITCTTKLKSQILTQSWFLRMYY